MLIDQAQDFTNNPQKRDFSKQQDLQQAMDQDIQIQDKDLHDKVLFAIQGLGSIRTIKQNNKSIQAYIKGPHCQQSIKDLVKFIRNDVQQNPKVKLILSEYNIVQTDLIQLLLLQVQDKKLSFWLIALLALMTQKPSQQLLQQQKQKLYRSLREYKSSFVKHQCLTILTVHIAQYFKTQKQNRQKAHYQMLQFIIVLLRNLLQIPDSKHENQSLHNHFLATLIRQEMFNPLLYLIQNQKSEIMDKIDIPLLQIFYYSFTCFNPDLIFKINSQKSYLRLANQAILNRGPIPLRHSRFLPNFIEFSDVGVKRITHNLNKKTQPILNQRKPIKRTAQLKKVQRIQMDDFAQNFMQFTFQIFDNESRQTITRKIGQVIYELAQQFVQVQLPQLSQLIKWQNNITKYHTLPIIMQLGYQNDQSQTLQTKKLSNSISLYIFNQAKNHIQAEQVQFDLAQIANIMQTPHFQLIYKTLFKQATRQKKKQFKINIFNAAIKLFQNYLNVISDISKSFRVSDRNNANILMANMFRHDIARIFKIGFQNIIHEGILKTLICVCHKFYRLLSKYSNGKILTIQTNKMLKRKNTKKLREQNQENMNDFISSDQSDDNQDGQKSYNMNQDVQKKQKVKKHKKQIKQHQSQNIDQPMFQQRKFNQISQFAIIAEYDIINKYLIFLKQNRLLQNTDDFNDSIFFYFQQICRLLKGEWLFYQAETLCVFQQILSQGNQFIKKNKKNIDKIKLIKSICKDFIKLLKKNKLALIESLFNYTNLSLKQKIFKNYDDGYDAGQEIQKNMFMDDQKNQ